MTPERWRRMKFFDKLRAVAAEIRRAEIWEGKDRELHEEALWRALELVDLSLDKPEKQSEIYPLLFLREKIGEIFSGGEGRAALLYSLM